MRRRMLLLFLLIGLLSGCNLPAELLPTSAAILNAKSTPFSDWETIAEGLAWRTLLPDGDELAQLIVIRINPQFYRFRAIYSPGNPRRLSEWREQEPSAALIVNANFFDAAYQVLGAVVSDGVVSGNAYESLGGSFLVRDGVPTVSTNRWRNSFPDVGIEQLVQGFPMLVDGGDPAYVRWSDSQRTRRTLVAEDSQGNILIMVSPYLGLSLPELSEYLTRTDLNIMRAVNLDGGGSTMIAFPGADYTQPSFDAVPTILAIYPR